MLVCSERIMIEDLVLLLRMFCEVQTKQLQATCGTPLDPPHPNIVHSSINLY
jgi:hypothetical protein